MNRFCRGHLDEYTDCEGNPVRVFPEHHVTLISGTWEDWGHLIYSEEERFIPDKNARAPAVQDGCFFDSGSFRFRNHTQPHDNPRVVEDLASEHGPTVWGDRYVRLPDGTEGPTVESLRSKRAMRDYMRLTGQREVEPGEKKFDPDKHVAEARARQTERDERRRYRAKQKGK